MKKMQEQHNALRQRIDALSENDSRQFGEMIVQQAVCHMADCLEMPLGRRASAPVKFPLPIPPGLLKVLALRAPLRWKPGTPTGEPYRQGGGGTPPAAWHTDKERLLGLLEEFYRHDGGWPVHPFFGAMSEADWRRWGYRHTDHHLRQFGR